MSEPFIKKTYYAMTLDPVHIGTGGYRLGRVDNTITREPGTNLPKVPGSSIAGATRAYTAMAVQNNADISKLIYKTKNGLLAVNESDYKKMKYLRPKYICNSSFDPDNSQNRIVKTADTETPEIEKNSKEKEKYYSCAGKGADDGEGHCGEPDCEVCVPFGFSKRGNSFQGLAQFYDARILFFPVHSMIGPVWLTSPSALSGIGVVGCEVGNDVFKAINRNYTTNLNLGWLLLNHDNPDRADINFNMFPTSSEFNNMYDTLKEKLFLVSDKLFSRIVNDNLEVRTSVAIDPATGAAEEGALFTYEAIPRAAVMWFDVVYNRPEYFKINGQSIDKDVTWIQNNVQDGLKYFESLGVGGMNTRGMGRMRVLNLGGL